MAAVGRADFLGQQASRSRTRGHAPPYTFLLALTLALALAPNLESRVLGRELHNGPHAVVVVDAVPEPEARRGARFERRANGTSQAAHHKQKQRQHHSQADHSAEKIKETQIAHEKEKPTWAEEMARWHSGSGGSLVLGTSIFPPINT